MQSWLKRSTERSLLRSAINTTLVDGRGKNLLFTIVQLCGAIESLPEMESLTNIDEEKLQKVKEAAIAEANNVSLGKEDSIKGILDGLKRPHLRKCLDRIFKKTLSELTNKKRAHFIHKICNFRKDGAHSRSLESHENRTLFYAGNLLLSVSILYDLNTSEYPSEDELRQVATAFEHAQYAAENLWNIKKQSK